MLSHVLHKLAQVAVTLAPRVGTVYSGAQGSAVRCKMVGWLQPGCPVVRAGQPAPPCPGDPPHPATRPWPRPATLSPLPRPWPRRPGTAATYNPTVALLESSSLTQIAMLSFGMRLRFTTHLLVRRLLRFLYAPAPPHSCLHMLLLARLATVPLPCSHACGVWGMPLVRGMRLDPVLP